VGRTITLNGAPFTVAGVAQQGFTGLTPGNVFDAWLPLSFKQRTNPRWRPDQDDAGSIWLVIVGRLKPGMPRTQAEAAVSLFFRNQTTNGDKPLAKPEDDPTVALLPMQTGLVGVRGRYSQPLYVLMWAVSIVLVIACANVAGLLLARATSRQKEIAIRLALGAGRGRIIRQLLTESVLLSLFGGTLGIVMATWLSHAIVSFVAGSSARPMGIAAQLDLRVLAFSAAISVLTGILFGLTPAFRGIRVSLTPALKENAGNISHAAHPGSGWFSIGNGLVVVQVALTIVVLAGAGLLVRTLQNLKNLDPGFDTSNTLLFSLDPTVSGYKGDRVDILYRDFYSRLAALPGVTSVSFSQVALLSGGRSSTSVDFMKPGTSEKTTIDTDWFPVGPNFFETVRIPLLMGRNFTPQDFTDASIRAAARAATPGSNAPAAPTTPRPVIVSEAFVRRFLGSTNPIGFTFGQDDGSSSEGPNKRPDPGMQIIGVARDAKYDSLRREVNPTTYAASSGSGGIFELRTAANPESLAPAVRNLVNQMDPNLPIFDLVTQTTQIDRLLFQERFIARLSSFFGVLALILACVGLYGLLSYEVTRRTREIGIRMALGAQQGNVLGMVVGRGIALTLAGAVIGTGVAIGVMKFIGSFLYDVKPRDPLTHAAVAGILLIIALAACYIPARRASRVDPLKALRYE
jgi:predicted permease